MELAKRPSQPVQPLWKCARECFPAERLDVMIAVLSQVAAICGYVHARSARFLGLST